MFRVNAEQMLRCVEVGSRAAVESVEDALQHQACHSISTAPAENGAPAGQWQVTFYGDGEVPFDCDDLKHLDTLEAAADQSRTSGVSCGYESD